MIIIYFLNILYFKFVFTHILVAESNYHKPKFERNNIVNKGVWVKNKLDENTFDRPSFGNYFFKPNSLDSDNILQNNFDNFAKDVMDQEPSITSYVERNKRSPELLPQDLRKHRPRKSLNGNNPLKNSIDEPMFVKSNGPEIRSLFNDYPYKIPNLTNPEHIELEQIDIATENTTVNETAISEVTTEKTVNKENVTEELKESTPSAELMYTLDYESEGSKTKDVVNDTDKSERSKKSNDRFDKSRVMWHQNAPVNPDTNIFTDNNVYELVHKDDKTRVTERGLIKVISMLTKTFKKIMKQHTEIKQIHSKMLKISNDLRKKVDDTELKFQDFDSKYSDMVQFGDKMKRFEDKMAAETLSLQKKQQEMNDNIAEFENQQKKFLTQQRQFYNIQKLMIAQNEKINLKQNMIAKTQSEISHRQNNFARILKKAKQVFYDNRVPQYQYNETHRETIEYAQEQTTPIPSENIKINLFSIPTKTKIENKDDLILKEKDLPIDELVYKFYFNNTFIDGLMKSKILNNFATSTNNVEIARNTKNKRDNIASTVLFPIDIETKNIRNKRWIDRLIKKKRRHTKKDKLQKLSTTTPMQDVKEIKMKLNDPFKKMAENFCNEIGQNYDKQTLQWCIEKAVRRLRFMEKRVFPGPIMMKDKKPHKLNMITQQTNLGSTHDGTTLNKVTVPSTLITITKAASSSLSPSPVTQTNAPTTKRDTDVFFPDNDELESNLAKYELKPDTEGNVYYDGSLHISDFGRKAAVTPTESGGMSDVMPGLTDSNSKVELDTFTFDLQAKRRAFVRRLNEKILKHFKTG